MLRRTPIAAALVLSFFAARADATVVKALTLEEKCQIAPLIVHSVVERIESEWDPNEEGSIRTLITVRVLETLKGDAKAGSKIVVYQGGGVVGEVHQEASGTSKFELGEEVVLFLEPTGPFLVEIGIGIGKYAISGSDADKWVTHAPNVAGVRMVPGERTKVEPIAPMEPMRIKPFLKLVRSTVAGIPSNPHPLRKGATKKAMPSEGSTR